MKGICVTASDYAPEDLTIGMSAQFDREITTADILAFAANSGDHNPLHVDVAYAATTNHGSCIAHGAFQVALASAMIGMHLPGLRVLLSSLQARFPAPLKFPTPVRVVGKIVAWNRETRSGRLNVTVIDNARELVTAEIGMGFAMHESRESQDAAASRSTCDALLNANASQANSEVQRGESRPVVLVTGASGGIGSRLLEPLSRHFDVIGTVNRGQLPEEVRSNPRIQALKVDFAHPEWPHELAASLPDAPLFGIVHGAWPSLPKGGLLQVPVEQIQQQLAYGTVHLIELGKLLAARCGDAGGRLIAIGSIAGHQRPTVNMAAYSLGKSALEDTVRLIAPELAGKRITCNALCPNFLAVGMNRQADERRQKIESAAIPMGRPCQPEDVLSAIDWLLSDAAAFVSGQIIGINGAQL